MIYLIIYFSIGFGCVMGSLSTDFAHIEEDLEYSKFAIWKILAAFSLWPIVYFGFWILWFYNYLKVDK